jgi:hypothetical protein
MGLGGPQWMDFGDILAIHVDLKAILDAVARGICGWSELDVTKLTLTIFFFLMIYYRI